MVMSRPSRSSLMISLLGFGLSLASAGCLPFGYGSSSSSFIEAEDVRLEVPGSEDVTTRAASNEMIRGDVQILAVATANDINAWVTSMVESAALVVGYLDGKPANGREGTTNIYGPHDDDQGRQLSWLVRLDGGLTNSNYELWVGPRGATGQDEMDVLMTGDLLVDGNMRTGGFMLDFDTVEKYSELKPYGDELFNYAGKANVTFERDTQSMKKHIDIDFDNYVVEYTGFLDGDSFSTDKTYVYHRHDDGAGVFHLSVMGEWDEWGWSGPEQEEMILDMAWTAEGSGRTQGQLVEVLGGDLNYGDLDLHECFGEDGYLTWREINESYAALDADYNFGDPASCMIGVEAFDEG